ncbi:conserved hypothetical protein [Candidatus Cloacimonas acidaminovorans str. Evry]|uniref:Uncharacterized protein n=1 Tax=Cloacimonas acidaminovorans (strain Evry) TaxID=459349 RepID=B0VIN2_CLOAI|nr:conserved hypothetical protein [Candidatus Cloacimonas acidaminovorans str. Evry]
MGIIGNDYASRIWKGNSGNITFHPCLPLYLLWRKNEKI